ncbi:MAG: FAD-dependent oxidoreductase [Chloroflexota bacterium]|nr:FAD-dependent oxidoreductase [Chloroflexota bacterium]
MIARDNVIIGAGPYGLAATAHLRAAGVQVRVFGQAMSSWERYMPVGMWLRSAWRASNIADPHHALTLDRYQAECGTRLRRPVPVESFIDYGRWVQRQIAPDLDQRSVTRLQRSAVGFQLVLEDGETVDAQRVVVAAGIAPFAWRPPHLAWLPPWLVSHASDHPDLGQFGGRRVLVLGGGQSALESAALLHEAGAQVEVVTRASRIRWLRGSDQARSLVDRQLDRWLRAPSEVGPYGLSWVVELPDLFRRLPRHVQQRIARVSILPAGAAWLIRRLVGVPITTGRTILSAAPDGGRLLLTLSDGSERCVDHLLLGTGYSVDVGRYPFLAPELTRSLRRVGGYPQLADGLESSVPGLHFLGAAAAGTFGPLMRFVAGTKYAAPALTRRLASERVAPAWEERLCSSTA